MMSAFGESGESIHSPVARRILLDQPSKKHTPRPKRYHSRCKANQHSPQSTKVAQTAPAATRTNPAADAAGTFISSCPAVVAAMAAAVTVTTPSTVHQGRQVSPSPDPGRQALTDQDQGRQVSPSPDPGRQALTDRESPDSVALFPVAKSEVSTSTAVITISTTAQDQEQRVENTTPASQAAFRYRRSPTHCGSIPRRSSLKKPQSHSHDDDCDDVSHSNRQHQSGSESGSWSGSRSTTQKARGVQFPSAAHEEAYVIGQAAADYDRSPHQRHGRKKHHSGGAESESHFAKSSHVATQPYFWIFVIVGCYIVRCCTL
jgi:hypothetical protein